MLSRQINAVANATDSARRLTSIPGVGPLIATALVSAVGDACQFKTARDLTAWLGLTPGNYSTGDKTKLTEISKRGNTYTRSISARNFSRRARFFFIAYSALAKLH